MVATSRMSDSIQVRVARSEDAEKITAVINQAFHIAECFFIDGDRIDLQNVVEYLNQGVFLLAESASELLGCVYVEPRGERSYLGLLSVVPASQHSGTGSLLMTEAENYCRKLGSCFMDIKIVNLREELPAFYRKRGYVETGTSPFPEGVETTMPVHFIDMEKPLT
jgi:N-acetylglutamate synthase-like GNAT family acetyltransferase